jgi:rhamnosyl/mannosyltransferase
MRVLHLGKYYYPYMGGIENHLHLLCRQLRGRVDLEVIVSNTRAATVTESVDGVPVTRCMEIGRLASTSLCPTMPWALRGRSYDLIHFHFPDPMGLMSYLVSRKPERHLIVVTYHGDIVRQARLLRLYVPFMDRVLARADAIICTSPNAIEGSAVLRRFRSKCRVIPLGIDIARFTSTPGIEAKAAEIRARYGAPIALCVGRLIYYKGTEFAIEAMRDVEGSLLLIGGGPLREALEAKARAWGLEGRVHFLGNVPDEEMMSHYLASDVFVFPSIARSEAFGIAQLEAMACRRPVVNTSLESGVPFVSRHGESGLTVAPANARALAGAIRTLFGDAEGARRMGAAGRARVEREFTSEVMGERTLALYAELAGSRPDSTM